MFRKSKLLIAISLSLCLIFGSVTSYAYYSGYPVSNPTLSTRNYTLHVWNSSSGYWTTSTVDGDDYLANYLKVKEFVSYSTTYDKLYSPHVFISTNFISSWNSMRSQTSTISLLCGYRSAAHNKRVGGDAQSQHKVGVAADAYTPSGYNDSTFKSLAYASGFKYAYIIGSGGSVHFDYRELPSGQIKGFPDITSTGSSLYAVAAEDYLICTDYSASVTGYFSSSEVGEVEDFQTDNGLSSTGDIDEDTWIKFHSITDSTP